MTVATLTSGERIEQILSSRPVPAGRSADVEVHTLLSRDHIPLYLIAAKSLMLHWPEPRLVIHDDGTLGDSGSAMLSLHLPGARVISREEADTAVAVALGDDHDLVAVRAYGPRLLQLVDYFLLAQVDRVIAMDSDVVVRSQPRAVLDWAAADPLACAGLLYSPEGPWTPMGVHWIEEHQPGMPYVPNMCCGFAATHRSSFWDPDLLAAAMRRMPSEILRGGRYLSQMGYSLLGGRLTGTRAAQSLGAGYQSGRRDQVGHIPDVVYHYFGSELGDAAENVMREWDVMAEVLEGLRT